MKRIIVTGAAGFLGSNLTQKLLAQGHSVVGFDNFITGSRKNLDLLNSNTNFTFFERDINFPFILPKKVLEVDEIYHLACPTGVDNLIPLAEEMLLTCSSGTKNVLELARFNKAKFLFTSSSEVYGDPKESPQKESYTGNVDMTGIRSPYEEGKRFSESLIATYCRKYRLDAKIVRIFNTYGPNMKETDSRVVPSFIRQATKNQPLTIHGKGFQRRTHCFVEDLVEGLILVMEKGEKGDIYNLGSDSEISVIELAQVILNLTKSRSDLKFVPRPQHDHQMRMPDLTHIKELGWSPKTLLKDGLLKTISKKEKRREIWQQFRRLSLYQA